MAVEVRLPLPDEQVFRYGAMDDILENSPEIRPRNSRTGTFND